MESLLPVRVDGWEAGPRCPWTTGQFEKAVSTEQEAIALLQREAEKNDYRTRLKLFEVHLPYRAKD